MKNKRDAYLANRYVRLQRSAMSRGIEFDLSLISLRNIINAKRCRYTKQELTLAPNLPNSLTVDRVDNTKGYIDGNVVACAKEFNEKKGNLSPEEIKSIMRILDNG